MINVLTRKMFPEFYDNFQQVHNQVVVTKCKDGSIVSKCYQEGDHILDVDGVRVFY